MIYQAARLSALYLLLFALFAGLFACSSTSKNEVNLDEWLIESNRTRSFLSGYSVFRQQHYPVSTQAPIYVGGDDRQLVAAFSKALRVHFSSVNELLGDTGPNSEGFYLLMEPVRPVTASYSASGAEFKRINIKITDINKNYLFDKLTIDLSTPTDGQAQNSKVIHKAFTEAVDVLAGRT